MPAKYFAYDTETTGLEAGKDEIISFAYISLDENLHELAREQFFAFPSREELVAPEARAVNKYDRDVWASRGAVTQSLLRAKILAALQVHGGWSVLQLGHNLHFDHSMLVAMFSADTLRKLIGYRLIDTVVLATALDQAHGLTSDSYKLGDLCKRFEIDLTNAHDALGDIAATVMLYRAQLRHMRGGTELPAITVSPFLEKQAAGHFVFTKGKHKGKRPSEVDPGYKRWALDTVTLSDEERAALRG